jgi:hypothetical protein
MQPPDLLLEVRLHGLPRLPRTFQLAIMLGQQPRLRRRRFLLRRPQLFTPPH